MSPWRRNRKIVSMAAKARDAQPSTASDIAFGQINPGCHGRQSGGVSVDISRISPSERPAPASVAIPPTHWQAGTMEQIIQV
jgi:hypothetical protein